jgi:signal transduction histidine kinase
MKEVILNLLSNAVEFSSEGGEIEFVTTQCIKKGKPASICIEIKDNGPGIPQSMIDHVFDPYFTTKHKSSMHNGTGLGLFIAHQNMQDHGGTIEVKSNFNEGAVFTLTLPVNNSDEPLHSLDSGKA